MDLSDDEDLLMIEEEEEDESQKEEVDSVIVEDIRRRLFDVFKMFDEDCDGLIETDDVGHVLRSFGLNPSQTELQLVSEQTAKKSGRVSFEDLLPRVVSAIQNEEWKDDTPKQIHAAFQVITSNNYVQKDTLLQLLTSIGEPLTPQEVKQFLNHASADATQYTSSKTLNPQHMKQAVMNTPHFSFLESLFKDISLPQQTTELNTARSAMTLREQQIYQEQQNSDMASAILANAQMQMIQMEQQKGAELPYLGAGPPPVPLYLQGIPPANYPVVQELAATIPLSPSTPTTQLVNGMMGMLKCNGKKGAEPVTAGIKRASTDGGDEDRPKRGRPKKLKAEKCIDDDLYEEASKNVAKEDKDRELMPPPALPIGRP